MRTKSLERDKIKEESITIAVTKKEKETIQKTADELDMSMSNFMRLAFKDFMKKSGW